MHKRKSFKTNFGSCVVEIDFFMQNLFFKLISCLASLMY